MGGESPAVSHCSLDETKSWLYSNRDQLGQIQEAEAPAHGYSCTEQPHPALRQLRVASPTRGQRMLCESQLYISPQSLAQGPKPTVSVLAHCCSGSTLWVQLHATQLHPFASSLISHALGTVARYKRTRTAADGDWHDATLAMDLDGTRHPLKREQSPEESRSKIPSEYVYRCRHRQNNSLP